jgi:hypothetical protein
MRLCVVGSLAYSDQTALNTSLATLHAANPITFLCTDDRYSNVAVWARTWAAARSIPWSSGGHYLDGAGYSGIAARPVALMQDFQCTNLLTCGTGGDIRAAVASASKMGVTSLSIPAGAELVMTIIQAVLANRPQEPDVDPSPTTPPVNVDVPYVSGTGAVGEILNCTMGNWTQMESGAYSYQWKRDATIDIGIGESYTVTEADVGHALTCVVTATNTLGSTVAPPSNAVAVV